jgi:hypothetical protein
LWTPLIRRLSAILLASMFVSAVFEFGKIDAIGHLMIIAILVAITLDHEKALLHKSYFAPVAYLAGLAGVISAYYGFHILFYGNS